MYTLFTRSLPFDIVGRVWDNFLIDGDVVLFQVSLGILVYFQHELESRSLDDCMTILSSSTTTSFDYIDADKFFDCISSLNVTKERVDRCMRVAKKELDKSRRNLPFTAVVAKPQEPYCTSTPRSDETRIHSSLQPNAHMEHDEYLRDSPGQMSEATLNDDHLGHIETTRSDPSCQQGRQEMLRTTHKKPVGLKDSPSNWLTSSSDLKNIFGEDNANDYARNGLVRDRRTWSTDGFSGDDETQAEATNNNDGKCARRHHLSHTRFRRIVSMNRQLVAQTENPVNTENPLDRENSCSLPRTHSHTNSETASARGTQHFPTEEHQTVTKLKKKHPLVTTYLGFRRKFK